MSTISVLNTDSGLSGKTLDLLESDQTITGLKTFSRGAQVPFAVAVGSLKVTNLVADKLDDQEGTYYLDVANATGTLAIARGGTNKSTVPTNGQLLVGNGTDYTLAALTAGTGITVTNGAGTITIAAGGVLDRDVTVTTVNNTNAETTVYTYSVPGGTLSTNKKLRITLVGKYVNATAGSENFTIRLKYGGTNVISQLLGGTNTTFPIMLIAEIAAENSASAQRAMSLFFMGGSTADAGLVATTVYQGKHDTLAVDSTTAQTLAITWQFSNTSASLTFTCEHVFVELLA